MEEIKNKLKSISWEYADKDLAAINVLENRISEIGKNFGLISYSDLVKGVDFNYRNINERAPYRISIYEWSGLDRRIIGDCLGFISMKSYLEAEFMASALVVARLESKPSDIFFEWVCSLKMIEDTSEDSVLRFWTEQVNKAHSWYKYGKKI